MLHSLDDIGKLDLSVHEAFERASGLPWASTVGQLAAAHGVQRWRGFEDVVPIPSALGCGVPFRHSYDAAKVLKIACGQCGR